MGKVFTSPMEWCAKAKTSTIVKNLGQYKKIEALEKKLALLQNPSPPCKQDILTEEVLVDTWPWACTRQWQTYGFGSGTWHPPTPCNSFLFLANLVGFCLVMMHASSLTSGRRWRLSLFNPSCHTSPPHSARNGSWWWTLHLNATNWGHAQFTISLFLSCKWFCHIPTKCSYITSIYHFYDRDWNDMPFHC